MVIGSLPLAAIDLGGNSFRLLIALAPTASGDGRVILCRHRATVSLARWQNDPNEVGRPVYDYRGNRLCAPVSPAHERNCAARLDEAPNKIVRPATPGV